MRAAVRALDELLGVEIPVSLGGCDLGFVRLIDYMGDEAAIVQAARVSYGAGTKTWREDRGLIRYLLEHGHTTPFEMVSLKLHVRAPMDVWRQWIRHRTAKVNEYSTRYSEAIDDCAQIPADGWRTQSKDNRQGSSGFVESWPEGFDGGRIFPLLDRETGETIGHARPSDTCSPGEYLSSRQDELLRSAREVYEERLRFGVAREQARKDLPLSTMTEAYWKMDMHNLLMFLGKRQHSDAQAEIRCFADAIAGIVEIGYPAVWEAHCDFDRHKDAVSLSRPEIEAFAAALGAHLGQTRIEALVESVLEDPVGFDFLPSTRAVKDAREKLVRILGGEGDA